MYFKLPQHLQRNGSISLNYLHTSRIVNETHYDVLKLPKDCTTKQIKESFIKLSKEYHPDSNNKNSSQKNFVKLVDAYNVLSKPISRRSYDLGLGHPLRSTKPPSYAYYNDGFCDDPPPKRNPWADPSFYSNRDKTKDKYYRSKPYYGVNGIPKMSNGSIVIICFLVAFTGVMLQTIAIKNSVTLKREEMLQKSTEAEHILVKLKREANENGNEVQLERLKERFKNNPYTQFQSDE